MKVVFAYPEWTGEYGLFGHFAKRNSTWPPLNLALLAAVCEQAGHEAEIIDGEAMQFDAKFLAKAIVATRPDLVGLSAYSPFFHLSAEVAAEVKKINPSIPIMGGGPHFTIMKEKAMLPQFDYGFMGEAEEGLRAFLRYRSSLENNFSPLLVKGLLWKTMNGAVTNNGDAWLATEAMKKSELGGQYPLDRIPLPARHLLPMEKYRLGTRDGRTHFTSIQTARGCPWRCIFCCSDKLMTTRYIMKSPKRVIEEMRDIKARFPYISHLYFADDVLTFWPEHITEIVDRMDAEGLKFTFEGSTRANLVDEKIIKRLARSGLVRLSFGLETVDPVMRVTMQKKVPLSAYTDANRVCNEHGVEAMNSLMIGLPGETRESVKTTINWVARSRDIKQANLAIAIPYPGTEFHDMATDGAHGVELLSENFEDYMRYGNAVTNVGDLTSKDLISLQNWGFVKIYFMPWRWLPVIHKHGMTGFMLQFIRLFKVWRDVILEKAKPFRIHPGMP